MKKPMPTWVLVAKLVAMVADLVVTWLLLILSMWLAYKGEIDSALFALIAHSLYCIEVRMGRGQAIKDKGVSTG